MNKIENGYITRALYWLLQFLNKLCLNLLRKREDALVFQTSSLPDMSSIDNAIGIECYTDRLDELLINRSESVREIAITSPYSGGKSSFLKTYFKNKPVFKCINISLAEFTKKENGIDCNKKNMPCDDSSQKKYLSIEQSIVQQILYREKSENVPNSRFRRIKIKSFNNITLLCHAIIIIWLAICSFLVINPSALQAKSIIQFFQEFISPSSLTFIIWGSLLSFGTLLLRDVLKGALNYQPKNINLLKGEATLEQKSHESVFNLYIEELIYFFNKSKTDVVIIEDLERLKNSQIFIKLQEVNKLLNNSKDIDQSITFIYAAKDNIFEGAERTKFFHSVIPIIPITHKSNAYPTLMGILEKAGIKADFTDSFIRDIAIYIEDMRMFNSVVAEYGIYKLTLNVKRETDFDISALQKLFSFIVYKNKYSNDFALLLKEKGELYGLFQNRIDIQQLLCREIDEEIEGLREQFKSIEVEHLSSQKELRAAAVIQISNAIGQTNLINAIQNVPITTIIDDQASYKKILQINSGYIFTNSSNQNQNTNKTPASILKSIKFDERQLALTNIIQNRRLELELKLTELTFKRQKVLSYSLEQLIKENPEIDAFKLLNKKPLLKHMIEKGYIDRTYYLYIAAYGEGDIAQSDLDFVMSVKSNSPLELTKEIINCDMVFEYFDDIEYQSIAILNYNYIDYLLEKHEHARIATLILTIKQKTDPITCLLDIYNAISQQTDWLKSIVKVYPELWLTLSTVTQTDTLEVKIKLIIALLSNNYFELDSISNDYQGLLCTRLTSFDDLSIYSPEDASALDLFIKNIAKLGVKIQLKSGMINSKLFSGKVIENNAFLVSMTTFDYLLSQGRNSTADLGYYTLDNVLAIDNQQLNTYLLTDRIEEICELLFDVNNEFTVIDEENVLKILNSIYLTEESRKIFISTIVFTLSNISQLSSFSDELIFKLLIEKECIQPTWLNVSHLLSNFNSSNEKYYYSQLAAYLTLKTTHTPLSKDVNGFLNEFDNSEKRDDFFRYLADEITDEDALLNLSVGYNEEYLQLNWTLLGEKFTCFIINNRTSFNKVWMKDFTNTEFIYAYIAVHIKDFKKWSLNNEFSFDYSEMDRILLYLNDSLDIVFVLSMNNENDVKQSFLSNTNADKAIQAAIEKPTARVEFAPLMHMVEITPNVKLLMHRVLYLTNEQVGSLLTTLNGEYKSIVTNVTHAVLPSTVNNKTLANNLLERGFISSISEAGNKIRINKFSKKLIR